MGMRGPVYWRQGRGGVYFNIGLYPATVKAAGCAREERRRLRDGEAVLVFF